MFDHQQTEWPTRSRLEELREEGEVVYSRLAVRAFVALSVVLFFALMAPELKSLAKQALAGWQTNDLDDIGSAYFWAACWGQLRPLIFGPLLLLSVLTLFLGLLQSRFLFRVSSLLPSWERLNPFRKWSIGRFLSSGIKAFLLLLLIWVFGFSFLWYYSAKVFNLLNASRADIMEVLISLGSGLSYFLVPVLFILGLASWGIARLRFMNAHRMTREEARAED